MASEWVEGFQRSVMPDRLVMDAAGVPVDNVVRARETDDGVEVVFLATTAGGDELVGGDELEPVEATMIIPGGMIVDQDDEV